MWKEPGRGAKSPQAESFHAMTYDRGDGNRNASVIVIITIIRGSTSFT